jgi:hypothetical protein
MKPGAWDGCLCIGCLERRIGRVLKPHDFPDHVFNTSLPGTSRLMERQGRLGSFDGASVTFPVRPDHVFNDRGAP